MDQPEYRWEPLHQQWVVIARARAGRPNEFSRESIHRGSRCPFCVGHEKDTPAAIREYRLQPESLEWNVRVVPNKYPALSPVSDAISEASIASGSPAEGIHEVIVDAPQHVTTTSQLPTNHLALALRVYRDRLRSVTESGLRYGVIFKNVGPNAGASIAHTHSQLIGLPTVPAAVQQRVTREAEHFQAADNCLLCDQIQQLPQELVVTEEDEWLAYCPYASRCGSEIRLLSRSHAARFEDLADDAFEGLASLLGDMLRRLEATYPGIDYNLIIQSGPATCDDRATHWHLEILPRHNHLAGFEWASGCLINPIAPEEAAARLRGDG